MTRVSGGVHALIVTNARVPWICRYGATARVQLSLFLSFSSSNDRGDIFEKKYNAREGARDSAGMRRPFVAAARSDSIQFLLLRVIIKLRPLDSNRYDHLFLPLLADLSRTCARHNLRGNLGMGIFPVEVGVRSD